MKEKEKRRGKRRREEEEEEIKQAKVWNFGFLYGNYFEYGFCMDHMEF